MIIALTSPYRRGNTDDAVGLLVCTHCFEVPSSYQMNKLPPWLSHQSCPGTAPEGGLVPIIAVATTPLLGLPQMLALPLIRH